MEAKKARDLAMVANKKYELDDVLDFVVSRAKQGSFQAVFVVNRWQPEIEKRLMEFGYGVTTDKHGNVTVSWKAP